MCARFKRQFENKKRKRAYKKKKRKSSDLIVVYIVNVQIDKLNVKRKIGIILFSSLHFYTLCAPVDSCCVEFIV